MTEETNIEINLESVEEIGESILDHLESIQDKYTELEPRLDLDSRADLGITFHQFIAGTQDGCCRTGNSFLPWAAVIAARRIARRTLRRGCQQGTQEGSTIQSAAMLHVFIRQARITSTINSLLIRQCQ